MSDDYTRISDDDYAKLMFHVRGNLNALWADCKCHGLDVLVEGNIKETIKLCENFGMAVRGKKKPIDVIHEYKRKATE